MTCISCSVKPNCAKGQGEISPLQNGKATTCPARGLAPTSLFTPAKIITLKLGLHLSLLTSFLYTSLLHNLVAGTLGDDLPAFSEPGGKEEEPGEAQKCLPSTLELPALSEGSFIPILQMKLRLRKFSCLVRGHPASKWWRPFSQSRIGVALRVADTPSTGRKIQVRAFLGRKGYT